HDLTCLANRAAPLRLPCVAALLALGRPEMVNDVIRLIDRIHGELHLLTDFTNLRADVPARIYSVPIVAVMEAAGMAPDQPLDETALIGAAVLTGAIARLAREAQVRLARLGGDASALGLKTFAAYAEALAQEAAQAGALFDLSLAAGTPTATNIARPAFYPD